MLCGLRVREDTVPHFTSPGSYTKRKHHRPAGILGFFRGKPIFKIFVLSSQTETLYAQYDYVNDGSDEGQCEVHTSPGS